MHTLHSLQTFSSSFSSLPLMYYVSSLLCLGLYFFSYSSLFLCLKSISHLIWIPSRSFIFFLFHSQLLHFFLIFPTMINTDMGKRFSSALLGHLKNPPGICHTVSIFEIHLKIFHDWSWVMCKLSFPVGFLLITVWILCV